jgi:hypothetical protein
MSPAGAPLPLVFPLFLAAALGSHSLTSGRGAVCFRRLPAAAPSVWPGKQLLVMLLFERQRRQKHVQRREWSESGEDELGWCVGLVTCGIKGKFVREKIRYTISEQ